MPSATTAIAVPETFVGEIHVSHCEEASDRHTGIAHLITTGVQLKLEAEEVLNKLHIPGVDEIVLGGHNIHVVARRLPGGRCRSYDELYQLGTEAASAVQQWAHGNQERAAEFTYIPDETGMAVNSDARLDGGIPLYS